MKNTKKILLFVLILIGSNVIEAYSNITVTIVYGNPNKKNCEGSGICYVKIDVNETLLRERESNAIANLNSGKRLVLTLSKKEMSPRTFTDFFSKGTFICEENFPVSLEILKALNYYGTYTIKAGGYPVKIMGDAITIVF